MKHRKLLALLWALVVTLTLVLGASQWISKRVALDTDILALLPTPERDPVLQQAFTQMVDSAQQKMVVLIGADDWAGARRAADAYRAVLAPHGDVLQFSDGAGEQTQQDWLTLFQKHRTVLMTAADETALRRQPAQHWVDGALTRLYSPFAGPQAGGWQDDPFGLFSGWMQQRAQETPVRPRDGYLFVADGNRPYVVMPLTLRVPAFSMDVQNTVTPLLDQARQAALGATPGAEVLSAGVILHAAAASKQASTEMSIIGIGSVIGIMLLVWFSFRSLKPIGYMLVLITVGCLGALSVCLLLFERVHLLTLVFGATLIGVAQDYGIYFLCNRAGADRTTDSSQLLRRLLPSLLLTLAAAIVGYLGLTLTPFPGLRQMAVFSISGLLFAWLTVVFWFPVLAGPNSLTNTQFAQSFGTMLSRWPVLRLNWQSGLAVLMVAILAIAGWSRLGFNDDIRALQRTPQDLLDQQLKLGALLDAPTPVQFYLVRGDSAEMVLQREEALKSKLDPLIAKQVLSGYQAISNWVPSARTQTLRQALTAEKLLADGAALPVLATRIEEDAAWVEAMRRRAITPTAAPAALTPELFLEAPAGAPWRHLWLGKTGSGFASVVALRGVRLANLPELQDATIGIDGVQWVDKVAEISSVFARYRQYMGWVLLCSYIAVFCLLFARYRATTWRTLAPAMVASTVTIAVLSLAGHSLQLFHVLALMLLLGIGVDYGVFFQERSAQRPAAAWLAVSLSVASTVLAFGLLGLSSTPALQAFGLTMLLGTTLVWLIVPCFRRDAMEDTCMQS